MPFLKFSLLLLSLSVCVIGKPGKSWVSSLLNEEDEIPPDDRSWELQFEENSLEDEAKARITDHPYQVSIQKGKQHYCSGAIINPRLIMTVAACVEGGVTTVKAGVNYTNSGGEDIKIKRFVFHPNYNPQTLEYDVAIILLAESLKFSESISAVNLPKPAEELPVTLNFSSYGLIQNNIDENKQLQKISLKPISADKCKDEHGIPVTSDKFCAVPLADRDRCEGDFGDLLTNENTLYGLLSKQFRSCKSRREPLVLIELQKLFSFIANVTNELQ